LDLIDKKDEPMLVATTDGTGTKTKIVKNPEDILYHGFNDLSAVGVKPIAFMLYIAGNCKEETLEEISKKAHEISQKTGVAILDSTCRFNDHYLPGEVDIAGTVIGVADRDELITGKDVAPGDAVIGIATDGLMTNGYSLARRLCYEMIKNGYVKDMNEPIDLLGGESLYQALSKPHRRMDDILFGTDKTPGVLTKFPLAVKGTAHITGGGLEDNSVRMIPDGCKLVYQNFGIQMPPIMKLFYKYGLPEEEMFKTFNMGVGFTLTVESEKADRIVDHINKHFRNKISGFDRKAAKIGTIEKREPKFERFAEPEMID
jgi:phosphoribosylformylglycinamidine cyclo-ligase